MNLKVIRFAKKNKILKKLVYLIGRTKLQSIFKNDIEPFLKEGEKILDIGAGTCNLAEILKKEGYEPTSLDMVDISFVDGIKPILYDGKRIPFKEKSFDVALIISVLHHTQNQGEILLEARRVSRRVIVVEDTYKNQFQKQLVFFWDSLTNLEFGGNPHSNRRNSEWLNLLKSLGFRIVFNKERVFSPLFPFVFFGVYVASSD